jgi:hypothetical protein
MERYLRVVHFAWLTVGLAARKPVLLVPLLANVAFAAPLNLGLSVLLAMVDSDQAYYGLLAAGVTGLYFIDYFANGVTAALVHQVLSGRGTNLEAALLRTRKVAWGIAIFAAIAALFDFLQEYAVERNDGISRVATRFLHWVWTTASYVILPAMVLEERSFRDAFARSRQLARNNPTELGVGFLALGVVNYVFGLLTFAGAYQLLEYYSEQDQVLAALLSYTLVNLYFAASGYLKTTYFTCFYLWARECERARSSDIQLAPYPLSAVLV